MLRCTADGIRQGIGFFEQSTAEDPEFALGHAWIVLAHVIAAMGFVGGVPPEESYTRAREAASRATALDPAVGDAHGAMALVKLVVGQRSVACNPRTVGGCSALN